MPARPHFLLAALCLLLAADSYAQQTGYWSPRFAESPRSADVTAMLVTQAGTLCLGGTFTRINDQRIHNAACYVDGRWAQWGDSTLAPVRRLSQDRNGQLFAEVAAPNPIVHFTQAGETRTIPLTDTPFPMSERWGAQRSMPLFEVVDDTTAYIVHDLQYQGTTYQVDEYFWNGTEWQLLSHASRSDMFLHAITRDGGAYRARRFLNPDASIQHARLQRRRGPDSLATLILPAIMSEEHIEGLATDAQSRVYVSTDQHTARLEADDTWTLLGKAGGYVQVPDGETPYLVEVTTVDDRRTALSFRRWNGQAWAAHAAPFSMEQLSTLGMTNGAYLGSVAVDADGGIWVEAIGRVKDRLITADFTTRLLIHWDGQAWGVHTELGQDGGLGISVSDFAVAAGTFFTLGTETFPDDLLAWKGSGWQEVYEDDIAFSMKHLAPDDQGRLYVSGGFSWSHPEIVKYTRIGRWDGNTWDFLNNSTQDWTSLHYSIQDLHFAEGKLYAARCTHGYRPDNDPPPGSQVMVWDGTAWESLGPTNFDGCVRTVLTGPDGALYAAGRFEAQGDVPTQNVARWDGAAWKPLGEGLSFEALQPPSWEEPHLGVETLFFLGETLYAGGFFADETGKTNGLARWDAASENWSPVDAALEGRINDVAMDPTGGVYLCGVFDRIGGVEAHRVVHWDGQETWSALDYGLHGTCNTIGVDTEQAVWVSGSFQHVGQDFVPSVNLARWIPGAPPAAPVGAPEASVALAVFPNPATDGTVLTLTLAASTNQQVAVAVYDVLGRRQQSFDVMSLEPDMPTTLRIDTGRLSSGLYFVQVRSRGGVTSEPFTILR